VAALRTLLRCLIALFLWIGVSGAASVPSAPASTSGHTSAQASQADLHDRLLDLLGVGICGDDESDDDNIFCGGDLLADLVSDPALLLMSRGTCSRLLEQLYNRQVCDPHKEDCGQMHPGAPVSPQGPRLLVSASAGLIAQCNAGFTLLGSELCVGRPRDGPLPCSHDVAPIPPPPRPVLA
jgi:hypothetical protein